jgi:hypothetical protein
LSGDDYTDPGAFAAGFRTAMLLCAVLLTVGGVLALLTVRRPLAAPSSAGPAEDDERVHVEQCVHCGVDAPPLHPPQRH